MNSIDTNVLNLDSPTAKVWKTQTEKGLHTPHRVSRITCMINQDVSDVVFEFLKKVNVDAYLEKGRTIREYIKPYAFGLPGKKIKLHSTLVNVFRFTVPQEYAKAIMESIIDIAEMHLPGRGTIFSQDLIQFSKEAPTINAQNLVKPSIPHQEINFLSDLSYVVCVLTSPGSGELLGKTALELGICVPLITLGTGNDFRDQLGLIRITISPDKEVVHLVMPEHDSNSIIQLLAEESKLDRPGSGYIYQTPVTMGLIDSRIQIGRQSHAASIDQIIAAIDTLKQGTNWRKRLDAENQNNIYKSCLPKENCEIVIISEEDRIDELREACIKVGASGAVTSRISPLKGSGENNTLIRSEVSVAAEITDKVVDTLLEISTIKDKTTDRIQVLDSPKAFLNG